MIIAKPTMCINGRRRSLIRQKSENISKMSSTKPELSEILLLSINYY